MEARQVFVDLWDSRHWRWWTLLAGMLLVAVTALAAFVVGTIIGHEIAGLTLLGLLAEIVVISVIGGGFLDSITRRMSRGGLARETADIDELQEMKTGRKRRMTDEEARRRDRRAIRSGILILPVVVAFLLLLFLR